MKMKVYRGLLHLLYESPWYTCLGDFVVVSSISLKQISQHRCLAEGLWIASLEFPFISIVVCCGNVKRKCFTKFVQIMPLWPKMAPPMSHCLHRL